MHINLRVWDLYYLILKYTPFQGQIICGKSHLVDTTYYDDHENGQHLNGVNIFIIVY